MRSLRRIGKSAYITLNSRTLDESNRILNRLVDGDIHEACKLYKSASKVIRQRALMQSVTQNLNKNHPRVARAPTPEQQVAFFTQAIHKTPLSFVDQQKFHVALTYQAIEAGDIEIVRQQADKLQASLPQLQKLRARTELALTKKRGHHLYYSSALSLVHAALAVRDLHLFERTINNTHTFFETRTLPFKDKGFGWALPNTMRMAGLGFIFQHFSNEEEEAQVFDTWATRMLQLAVSRRVGPMEHAQVRLSFAIKERMRHIDQNNLEADGINLLCTLLRIRNTSRRSELAKILYNSNGGNG